MIAALIYVLIVSLLGYIPLAAAFGIGVLVRRFA